jgi:alkanesulfonate monooxygenase SsuD/methylene tetrahydromethanopterin reductase-like flavin-dependent oxidoreductase (luciferase family)
MKIGLTIDTPATAVADAQLAEQLGFDYVACGEHLFFHGPVPNSLAVLAAAAGATSRMRCCVTGV